MLTELLYALKEKNEISYDIRANWSESSHIVWLFRSQESQLVSPCRGFTSNKRYLECHVLIPLCMCSCRSEYSRRMYIIILIKLYWYVLSITGMRPFTYLYSLSPAGAVSVYLFIATVYSVANWYVYCRSIFHIWVCHTYCLFPLVIKIWKSSFFLHFSNISYVSKFFGIIIRKVNITSNVL